MSQEKGEKRKKKELKQSQMNKGKKNSERKHKRQDSQKARDQIVNINPNVVLMLVRSKCHSKIPQAR